MEKIVKENIEDIFALTPMQEGMLFYYLKDPGSGRNFEQLSVEIPGKILRRRFEKAWNFVSETNEMLRTVFRWEETGKPIQVILKEHKITPVWYDFSGEDPGEAAKHTAAVREKDLQEKFDLRRVPFRVTLCKVEKDTCEMIVSNHHILYDGWSSGILLKEFFYAYHELCAGREPRKPVKTKFKEFVKTVRNRDIHREKRFWEGYLKDLAKKPGTPVKRGRAGEVNHTGVCRLPFPKELPEQLEAFARKYRITLSTVLYGAWALLLQRYNSTDDTVYDTTVSGRSAGVGLKRIEEMVGLFINTIPLRVKTGSGEAAADFLSRLHNTLLQREEFETASPEVFREYLDIHAGAGLFDSLVVIENYPVDQANQPALGRRIFSADERTGYDLTVIFMLFADMEVRLTYNRELFDEETGAGLCRQFMQILRAFMENPRDSVSAVHIVPEEEKSRLIDHWKRCREPGPGSPITAGYRAPRDEGEERVAAAWAAVVKVDKNSIGIDDCFFDAGGHSLAASMLAAALHKEFQVKVPLAEIFRNPTTRELSAFITGRAGSTDRCEPIEAVEEKEYYPCSSAQERFYMIQQLDPDSVVYNGITALVIEGAPDKNKLEACFKALVQRHESFRTSFHMVENRPVQKVHEKADFAIEYDSIPAEPGSAVSCLHPFDLSRAPLLRVKLVTIEENKLLLLVEMHHIIIDGVSEAIVMNELAALYRGETLTPPRLQYKDFCQWQHRSLACGRFREQEAFWLRQFSPPPPVLRLPLDFPRPPLLSFEGNTVHYRVAKTVREKTGNLMKTTGTTLFMVLLAVYNVLLSKYTGGQDIVIGTATAARHHADLQDIAGLVVETLAVRNYPSGERRFIDFLQEVRQRSLDAFENQTYPFRKLTRKLGLETGAHRNPLFDVMLIVQDYSRTAPELEGLTLTPYPVENRVARLDIYLEAWETDNGIDLALQYGTALFRKETMERFLRHFVTLLETAADNPRARISHIEMLTPGERAYVMQTGHSEKLEAEFDF